MEMKTKNRTEGSVSKEHDWSVDSIRKQISSLSAPSSVANLSTIVAVLVLLSLNFLEQAGGTRDIPILETITTQIDALGDGFLFSIKSIAILAVVLALFAGWYVERIRAEDRADQLRFELEMLENPEPDEAG